MTHDLLEEAAAFDRHARERLDHGHIPDLQRVEPCDWFYNNPWRRPYLADMVFGRYFRFALANLTGSTILEVGSGLGHMSLEFARNGYEVTGIELSAEAVAGAKRVAEENPFKDGFGSLEYIVGDYLALPLTRQFDNVCFFGGLHHFDNVAQVVERTRNLVKESGRVIVIEPARDWLTEKDGAVIALIRLLLAEGKNWYDVLPLPRDAAEISRYAGECLREFQDATDKAEAAQSPHDNAAFAADMLAALRAEFEEVSFEPGFAFFPRLGGGVRGESEQEAQSIAEFLYEFDNYAVKSGLMNPSGFLWAGKRG